MTGIKGLIGPHHRHQILGVAEVDDVVGVSWQHMDGLNLLPAHIMSKDGIRLSVRVRSHLPFLDTGMTGHDDEEFPFGVVPVLALGDARLADIDRYLAAGGCLDQLRKGTPQNRRRPILP